MRGRLRSTRFAGLVLLGVAVGACSSNTSPGIHPEINSAADNFQFQVTAVTNYSGTLSYSWLNNGTSANINQATTITAGDITLQLFDASGRQVYSQSLTANGTFVSTAGTPGNWTVRVTFMNASGTLNFRVQKRT